MSPPDRSTTLTLNATPAAENQMRAALGLPPGSGQHSRPLAHTPARSEGPAVSGSTRRLSETSDSLQARMANLANELKTERGERLAAQQSLADA